MRLSTKLIILFFIPTLTILNCDTAFSKSYNLKGKNILMIIASHNFRDEELLEPQKILRDYGANITIASSTIKNIKGMLGTEVKPDVLLKDIDLNDYDAIVFVGGSGATEYFNDTLALSIAKEAYKEQKVIAAICIAPNILANAGILSGKKATGFSSIKNNLMQYNVIFTGKPVEVDGRIITGSDPRAARDFGEKIAEVLQ